MLKKEEITLSACLLLTICAAEFGLCAVVQSAPFSHWLVYVFPAVRFLDFLAGGFAYILADSLKAKCSDSRIAVALGMSVICFLLCLTASLVLPDRALSEEFFSSAVWVLPSCFAVSSTYIAGGRGIGNFLFKNSLAMELGEISLEFFMLHQLAIRYFSEAPPLRGHYFTIYALSFAVTYFAAKTFHQRVTAT